MPIAVPTIEYVAQAKLKLPWSGIRFLQYDIVLEMSAATD